VIIPESPEEKKVDLDEQTFGPGDLTKLDQGIEQFLMQPKKSSEIKIRQEEAREHKDAVKKKSQKRGEMSPSIEQQK